MKIFTLLAALVLMASVSFAQITDGSFEAGAGGGTWIEASTNFGTPLCDLATCGDCGGPCLPNTGSIYAWFGGMGGTTETGSVEQTATFPSGTTASVDMMVYMPMPGNGGTLNTLNVYVDGAIVQTITANDSAAYNTAYTNFSVDVSSAADGMQHALKIEGTQGNTTVFNILVDDVVLIVDGNPTDVFDSFLDEKAISMYPNPASDVINLEFRNNMEDAIVNIYTITGELIASEEISEVMNKTFSYNTQDLSNGVYFVEVRCGEKIVKERIVISK